MLAALGIYGVVSPSVTQRTRELGTRLAFGAQPAALHRLVLRQGFVPVSWGLIGGIAVLAGGRLLASPLYETNARDPLTLSHGRQHRDRRHAHANPDSEHRKPGEKRHSFPRSNSATSAPNESEI